VTEWLKWFWNNDEGLRIIFWGSIALIPLLTGFWGILSNMVSHRRDFLKEEAARLEREAERAQLEEQADQLKKQVEEMSSQTKKLETKVEERDDIIQELEEKQKPRHLTVGQRHRLVAALSPFAGQKVYVSAYPSDPESNEFGIQIEGLLREAGWNSSGFHTAYRPDAVVGLDVRVGHRAGQATPAADALISMFRAEGFQAHGVVHPAKLDTKGLGF